MLTRLIVAFPSAARSLAPRLHVNSAELKSVPLLRLNRGPPLPRARNDFSRTLRIALQHQRSFRIPASLDPRGLSVRVNRKQVKRSNYESRCRSRDHRHVLSIAHRHISGIPRQIYRKILALSHRDVSNEQRRCSMKLELSRF